METVTIKIRYSDEDQCFVASVGGSDIAHGDTKEDALCEACAYISAVGGDVFDEHLRNDGIETRETF